jgi:hypothetical protein
MAFQYLAVRAVLFGINDHGRISGAYLSAGAPSAARRNADDAPNAQPRGAQLMDVLSEVARPPG